MEKNDDILASLEAQESNTFLNTGEYESTEMFSPIWFFKEETTGIQDWTECINFISQEQKVLPQKNKTFGWIIFLVKYICTSASIFAVLLLVSNYSAYWNIAKSIIYAQELEQTKNSLIESVAAGNLVEEVKEKSEFDTFKNLSVSGAQDEASLYQKHSLAAFVEKNSQDNMEIEITPYDNRIVIPKIGKNIPLVDISHPNVQGVDELNDIFMDELENGVVRYPGSAKPGEDGNTFIFWHSSNFPWMEGKYNDVFALLDKVVFDDEVIVYYGQEKFVYKIRSKNVIRPGDVSVLKSNPEIWASEITLMTCWPIGTTLNRLILTGDLVRIEK